MKRFYYKVENTTKNRSIYGGQKQKAIIYMIKKGELIKIGETRTWNTGSYIGSNGEVNSYLLAEKFIPKSWSKDIDGNFTRYYNDNDKYSITEI